MTCYLVFLKRLGKHCNDVSRRNVANSLFRKLAVHYVGP